MAFKVNVSNKGKTYKVETNGEDLVGKLIGDEIKGEEVDPSLKGYELTVTGTSDKAGFSGKKEVEGPDIKKLLVTYGHGMHKKPKGERKRNVKPKGLRMRKTFRGREISADTVQINTKVTKEGAKKFNSLFDVKEENIQEVKSE